jgi:hypothetical protein
MMDCMQSFTLNINNSFSFTAASGNFVEWNSLGTIKPWTVWESDSFTKSVFNIQGFKNIEVYGCSLVGIFRPSRSASLNNALVEDWGIGVTIDGRTPLINGFFGTNSFGATQGAKNVFLSKYQNEFKLSDPIQSVKNVTIDGLYVSGIQNENGTSVDMDVSLSLIVYYKYEGEDL